MKNSISLSVMCADLMNLKSEISVFEEMNVEYLHIDFMDGKFVPNITFGTDMIREFKGSINKMRRDIHIMAFKPAQYFEKMKIGKGDMVSVHYEACDDVKSTLEEIRNLGASPCIAISPDTDVEVVLQYADLIDSVLVMTVYPGFAGQPLAPNSFERISKVREMLNENGKENIEIQVDGNVSWENAVKMKKSGANNFVAGSSSIFEKNGYIKNNITKFR